MGALSRSFLWGLVGLENSTVSGWLIDLGAVSYTHLTLPTTPYV